MRAQRLGPTPVCAGWVEEARHPRGTTASDAKGPIRRWGRLQGATSQLPDRSAGRGQLRPREHPRTKSERRLADSALVVQPDVVCVLQSHYPLLRVGRFPPRRNLEKSNENLVKMGVGPF